MAGSILVDAGTSVTHCSGTSNRSPECRVCGSWINHWEKYTTKSFDNVVFAVARKKSVLILE